MGKNHLLLHACCAPCTVHVYELLSTDYKVTVYFSNSNISSADEYNRRLTELNGLASQKGFDFLIDDYSPYEWTRRIEPFSHLGEGSERCSECFRFRLARSFEKALEIDAETVTTTLTVSPHKNADTINTIGSDLAGYYSIPFLKENYKKNDGYKKSVDLSKKYGFYRQDYCGCMYSKRERENKSAIKNKGNHSTQIISS